ncbi:OPT superfamily oligopeptide transporter [Suhomyces tanzawaensis NRRL Y-17324]|uniref:OPT superfamily oligopeptide transporter n=1 Tax=Suhomyces tanzawaensis NRRL Y-17324 TaxID=984487 RepID=A0A1E4SCV9_9ASCO|nr:OPT superfamily oligopeptide transporter [Suhomyces tanzawaensis NRRL Y-17324]ODV77351.1 OPT superfamily oligopeptide transporter [Suhomyces tanzawaensis NRRL Y-17324]
MASSSTQQDHQAAISNVVSIYSHKIGLPQVTLRATFIGLLIGTVVLVSNFQFGLQTGWVSMMSLPSALLGFALFKLTPWADDFTDVENVYVQSVAVAVGTGPLAYGLIGIIPAIEKFLTPEESGIGRAIKFSLNELILWSLGLGLFGVFFAIPLRNQVIIKEKLPFPSGSATATLISVLHGTEIYNEEHDDKSRDPSTIQPKKISPAPAVSPAVNDTYSSNVSTLVKTFLVSASYTLLSYFFPILKKLPIFGNIASSKYKWNFEPSPAYIGQGIIMGLPTVSYMLFGALVGWGILAPFSKHVGWAPGPIDDFKNGGQGWILWLSLSVMISDSLVSFTIVTYKSIHNGIILMKKNREREIYDSLSLEEPLLVDSDSTYDPELGQPRLPRPSVSSERDKVEKVHLVSNKVAIFGVILSSLLCVVAIKLVFGPLVPLYATFVAIILALMFSILGVRALGETDLNPVSGIGKLSQLIFALVVPASNPSRILINLIAGGIAEAGAQQAGDLMQDLKTGHLIGASPRAQFTAQIIGTVYSVFLSSIMYKVYNAVYEIPGSMFRIPTAIIWIDCSRLVTGAGLPPYAFQFSIVSGLIFGMISIIKNVTPKTSKYHKWLVYLPNGVAVGIGIYNSPNFTLARFVGGVIAYWWVNYKGKSTDGGVNKIGMIIFSSGLVLGEGLLSAVTMILTSLGVQHF